MTSQAIVPKREVKGRELAAAKRARRRSRQPSPPEPSHEFQVAFRHKVRIGDEVRGQGDPVRLEELRAGNDAREVLRSVRRMKRLIDSGRIVYAPQCASASDFLSGR